VNAGKLLFAQLMDFLPWTSFARSVARYGGDCRVRSLTCTEQFRAMAFAQLTYRESLRDIEACLSAQPDKLYAMGFRSPVRRSTLAEANENRDWRIYAELAQRLMLQARKLYANECLGMDLDAAAYALDSTTIDLCLTLFPWAHFRSTKSAVKMHTLLDLRGNIPTFIRVTTGDMHDVNILDEIIPQAGAYYVMDRGYLDYARLYRIHLAGAFFVTRAKRNLDASRIYSEQVNKQAGILADQSIALNGHDSRKDYPSHLRRIRFHDPLTDKDLIWSDPVNLCTSVGLFLQLRLLFPLIENRASRSRGRFERRLISLIFAGRNRIILIRRDLPLTSGASPAEPVA